LGFFLIATKDGFPDCLPELDTAAGTSMPLAGATSTDLALAGANWLLPKWVTPFPSTQVAMPDSEVSAFAWPAAAMLSMAIMLSAAARTAVFATIMSVP